MTIPETKAAIEAMLFASGEPVAAYKIAQALELDEETTLRLLAELAEKHNDGDGGLQIVCMNNEYQFCTKPAYADTVRALLDIRRSAPLSPAAMEVLAIVAYNQPVTRAFIEQVRGVDCGAVLQGLTVKSLIEEAGRLDLPGRPLVYKTTADFLRSFGMESLKDLPPLPEEETMEETTLDEIIEEADAEKNAAAAGTEVRAETTDTGGIKIVGSVEEFSADEHEENVEEIVIGESAELDNKSSAGESVEIVAEVVFEISEEAPTEFSDEPADMPAEESVQFPADAEREASTP